MNKIRRLLISDPRNSVSTVRLRELDWQNWWTDRTLLGEIYLHVLRPSDGTHWRVFCKHYGTHRIEMRDGRLYWLIDPVTP
jgi:hypothetical protein